MLLLRLLYLAHGFLHRSKKVHSQHALRVLNGPLQHFKKVQVLAVLPVDEALELLLDVVDAGVKLFFLVDPKELVVILVDRNGCYGVRNRLIPLTILILLLRRGPLLIIFSRRLSAVTAATLVIILIDAGLRLLLQGKLLSEH